MRIHIQVMLLFMILILAVGCEEVTQKRKISNYELGKGKLIEEADGYKAAKYLKKAIDEKPEHNETRILLIIACRRSIEDGTAKLYGKQSEYEKIMHEEFNRLNTEKDIKSIIEVIREDNIIQKDAIQLLIDKGEKAVNPSIFALIYYAPIYDAITEVLIQIGEPALDDLVAKLEDPSSHSSIRVDITRIIGNMETDKVIPVLKKLTESKDEVVKMEAVASLFERGEKQYKNVIIAGLNSPNVKIRRSASHAMIFMNQSPIKTLIKAMKDKDTQVRINALIGVEKNPSSSAIKPLIDLLKNDRAKRKIEEDEKKLNELSIDLDKLEIKYKSLNTSSGNYRNRRMRSDKFYKKFKTGDLSNTEDFVKWAGLYEQYTNIKSRKDKLVAESDKVKNHIAKALIEIGKAGHASKITTELIDTLKDEKEWKSRLTIVRVLEDPDLMDDISKENAYKLYKYYEDVEDNRMVKNKIAELLNKIE